MQGCESGNKENGLRQLLRDRQDAAQAAQTSSRLPLRRAWNKVEQVLR